MEKEMIEEIKQKAKENETLRLLAITDVLTKEMILHKWFTRQEFDILVKESLDNLINESIEDALK